MRRTIQIVLAAAAAGAAGTAAADDFAQEYKLQIERTAVEQALTALSQQTGLNISFIAKPSSRPEVLVGPLQGRYTAEAALDQLTSGTGLSYMRVNATAVAIVEPQATAVKLARLDAEQSTAPARGAGTAKTPRRAPLGSASQGDKVEEVEVVIVTAQRRQQRLQDVPISVSVLDGNVLDGSSGQGINEVLNRVPGVADAGGSNRGGGTAKWVIRGVSGGAGTNTAGYYLDSIPFGFVRFDITPDSSPYDLARIEVLRGPQGTLYGANSLNGVIRILTKDADLDQFELKARTALSSTKDGDESYRGDLAVNIPIVEDKFAARAVFGYQKVGGWIDKPIEEDVNDSRIRTGRLKLNAQPSDQLSIGLLAWFSRADYGAPPISLDGRETPSQVPEPSSTDYDAYSLKVDYRFPQVTVSSATSYLDFSTVGVFDFSSFTPGLTSWADTRKRSEMFAQEINVASAYEGPWQWSLGGMYRDSKDPVLQLFEPFGIATDDNRISSESVAIFGELSRQFFDGVFEVTAGARYFEDKVTDENFNVATPTSDVDHFDAVTPRLVFNWRPDDRWTLYASYSEGFRSGLSQFPLVRSAAPTLPPADPDKLKNYELGAKGSQWSGRFNIETAVYFIDWQDVQQTLGVPVGGSFAAAFVNAPSASGVGIDFAATIEPLDGLTFAASFSWNDLEFDEDVTSFGEVLFDKGSRLNLSPQETAGVSAEYTFPIGGSGLRSYVSASASYISKTTTRMLADTILVATGDDILTSRASIAIESPDKWTATLFGDNLGDENKVVNRDPFRDIWSIYDRPRIIGLQFEYSF